MTDEVEPYDPQKIVEDIKWQIREKIMALVPQSHVDKMIEEEIKHFMSEERSERRGYHQDNSVSKHTLRGITRMQLREWAEERIKSTLNDKFSSQYEASDIIKDVLREKTPEIIASMFGQMLQSVVNQVRY